jgi:drug/metabolite transporter (DMT)-like permease
MSTIVREDVPPSRSVVPGATQSHIGTDLLVLLMAVIWGVNYISVKFATEQMPPLAFNGMRVTIAAFVLVLVSLVMRRGWPDRPTTIALLVLGALGNGLYQVFFIEGIARTQAGAAALVLAASPAFIAIIGQMRGVERVTRLRVAGIVASLVGMALVVFGTERVMPRAPITLKGNLLVLAACLCWSFYTVLLKPYTERVDGVRLSTLTMVGGAAPLLLLTGSTIARTPWHALSPLTWSALLYSSIVALVIGYFFWYRGVKILGPTRTAMYSNLQPAVALIAAWPMLGEVPTPLQIVGAVAIMAGVLLTRA